MGSSQMSGIVPACSSELSLLWKLQESSCRIFWVDATNLDDALSYSEVCGKVEVCLMS